MIKEYSPSIRIKVLPKSVWANWLVGAFGNTFIVLAATEKIPLNPTKFHEQYAAQHQLDKPGILMMPCESRTDIRQFFGWVALDEINWGSDD